MFEGLCRMNLLHLQSFTDCLCDETKDNRKYKGRKSETRDLLE